MLLRCIRKIKYKRVMVSALVVIIILGSITGAVFTAPVTVYALSAGGIKSTIASLIISLLLQTGAAPVNQSYVDALNTSYGYTIESAINDGLLTQTSEGLIDSGLSSSIASSSAYTDLGLEQIFTTTAEDAGVIAGSGAVNITNTAINVGTVGTIGAFAGAVGVGVGVGVLINHVRGYITNYIKYGLPMSKEVREGIINNIPSGYDKVYYGVRQFGSNVYSNFYFVENDSICVSYPVDDTQYPNGAYTTLLQSTENNFANANRISYINSTLDVDNTGRYTVGPNMSKASGNTLLDKKVDAEFNSMSEAQQYIDDWREGNVQLKPTFSPDIITDQGNAINDNGEIPGLVNQIPEGSDMNPVDMADYQNFMDSANNNTDNGQTGQPVQGEAFDDLIDSLIVAAPTIPDQPIIPDNPVDVPTVPDRPIVPEQPTIPDKPTIDQETLDQALQGATTIDLRAIFPFCIPFDLYNLLLIFDTGENRKAPHITFTFPITGWVIDVDLAPFDPVAGILRLLELIIFIIGLAVATRSLIGAGGG